MRTTWPLWECLSPASLVSLILYQWNNYGQRLDFLIDHFKELESREEIDHLMRQRPHPKGRGWRG